MGKTIFTIFAGRKDNLEILKKYLDIAIQRSIIQEVHFWNYTRDMSDDKWIQENSNLMRTSSVNEGRYIEIFPFIYNDSGYDTHFDCNISANNDIHFLLDNNTGTTYEIVIGGWSNTKTVVRANGNQIYEYCADWQADPFRKQNYIISINNNNILYVHRGDKKLVEVAICNNFNMNKILFKTGFGTSADIDFITTRNNCFFYMDTCQKKPWHNYYEHYLKKEYSDDIILKSDDDIVFMDVNKLDEFINYIKNNDNDLVFANTINNGVSAYYQQNKYDMIPTQLMTLEYPPGGFCGSLWESQEKALKLHQYFTSNARKFTDNTFDNDCIHISTRYSINFFGFKGSKWNKIADCGDDDEAKLTIHYVNDRGLHNVLYTNFIVSHLSFYSQHFDHELVRSWYRNLFDQYHN